MKMIHLKPFNELSRSGKYARNHTESRPSKEDRRIQYQKHKEQIQARLKRWRIKRRLSKPRLEQLLFGTRLDMASEEKHEKHLDQMREWARNHRRTRIPSGSGTPIHSGSGMRWR